MWIKRVIDSSSSKHHGVHLELVGQQAVAVLNGMDSQEARIQIQPLHGVGHDVGFPGQSRCVGRLEGDGVELLAVRAGAEGN